ncbi:MAG: HAD family phosphatase [Thermoleophilaceae bacterium]
MGLAGGAGLMALRCVYTDVDGTLLGPDASLFHDAGGRFTLLAARALEACHRAGCEVMLMSGRRRVQVAEDARLIGHTAYCFEVGGGLVIDGEQSWLCGELDPRDGLTPWELIERSGAPALLLEAHAGELEHHAPWHRDREVSHLFRGRIDLARARALLEREGHALRLVDNGGLPDGRRVYHLLPAAASKHAAVAAHMRARGYAAGECIAVGDSREDLGVAELVARFFLVANADADDAGATRTEAGHGDGFYEAVVRSLTELRGGA